MSAIRFGVFELDLNTGELRRRGIRVRLQEQPFQVLAMLVDRPGELVSREELRHRLWPTCVFVDFERGLNKAVHKIRQALGDRPDSARFAETLPRRGYRFLATIDDADRPAATVPATPSVSMCRIVWNGDSLPLREGTNVLGRGDAAGVPIDSAGVSRRHAEITVSPGAAILDDAGSKNGTFVNGRRVNGPVPLDDGDEIPLGSARMIFRRSCRAASTRTET